MNVSLVIIIFVFILLIWGIVSYNKLISNRNNIENAFANIDVQLQQRYDLIPQLVSTVKGYAKHERELLENVTKYRAAAVSATTIDGKVAADNKLTKSLSKLNLSLEAYPELKANQNFLHLQTEISDIENKLAASRRYFNTATREYNNSVQTFPSNIIAGIFNFTKAQMFEVSTEDRQTLSKTPKIEF